MHALKRCAVVGILSTVVATRVKPVYALDKPWEIHHHVMNLNKKDQSIVHEEKIQKLKKWSASAGFTNTIEKCSYEIIDDIDYIKVMYDELPLKPQQRIHVRTNLLRLYDRAGTEEEKSYIINIMRYYGVLED